MMGMVVLLAAFLAGAGSARAQEEGQAGGGFLTPFPPGDVYQLMAAGDGLAEGLLYGLNEALGADGRLTIAKKHRQISGIMRPDFDEALRGLEDTLAKEPAQIAIVMIGERDRVPLRGASGDRQSAPIGSEPWKAEYGRRVDRMMKVFRRRSISVYWVGLPNQRRAEATEDAQMMNDIVREKVFLNGFRFVDSMAGFADEQGGYSDMGPDITGKIRRLREGDGLNFTGAGNRKLAHFVERELRRDLTQAKQDRSIPLAGNEAEQAAIAPKPAPAPASAPTTAPAATGPQGPALDRDDCRDGGRDRRSKSRPRPHQPEDYRPRRARRVDHPRHRASGDSGICHQDRHAQRERRQAEPGRRNRLGSDPRRGHRDELDHARDRAGFRRPAEVATHPGALFPAAGQGRAVVAAGGPC